MTLILAATILVTLAPGGVYHSPECYAPTASTVRTTDELAAHWGMKAHTCIAPKAAEKNRCPGNMLPCAPEQDRPILTVLGTAHLGGGMAPTPPSGRTQAVSGYTRQDGTVVDSYMRTPATQGWTPAVSTQPAPYWNRP